MEIADVPSRQQITAHALIWEKVAELVFQTGWAVIRPDRTRAHTPGCTYRIIQRTDPPASVSVTPRILVCPSLCPPWTAVRVSVYLCLLPFLCFCLGRVDCTGLITLPHSSVFPGTPGNPPTSFCSFQDCAEHCYTTLSWILYSVQWHDASRSLTQIQPHLFI